MNCGRVLKINEYNLTYGKAEEVFNVFACFKDLKYGNEYVIFSSPSEYNYGILRYASVHKKENTIVTLDVKDPKVENIIKEFTWKVINKEPLDSYEIIDIKNTSKIEPISYNRLEIKPEFMLELDKLILREEPKIIENKPKKKKKNRIKILIILFFIIVIGTLSIYVYTHQDDIFGYNKIITCDITIPNNEIKANILEEIAFSYNRKLELVEIFTIRTYSFEDDKDYDTFYKNALGFKYEPDTEQYEYNADNKIYIAKYIETIDNVYRATNDTSYEEILTKYKSDGYVCKQTK